jgi:hypothetical protein
MEHDTELPTDQLDDAPGTPEVGTETVVGGLLATPRLHQLFLRGAEKARPYGLGRAANSAASTSRCRAIHLATVTGCIPRAWTTEAWNWPSNTWATADRHNASKTEADPLLRIRFGLGLLGVPYSSSQNGSR